MPEEAPKRPGGGLEEARRGQEEASKRRRGGPEAHKRPWLERFWRGFAEVLERFWRGFWRVGRRQKTFFPNGKSIKFKKQPPREQTSEQLDR